MQATTIKPVHWQKHCLATLIAATVFAGHASAQGLEEVVVTAQKREQSLKDVPISLSVLSGNALEASGISNVSNLFYIAPSVSFQSSVSSSGQGMLVRGVGGGAFASGFESSVGTTIDGVVTGPGGSALAEFWDVERIEVLRGPQGTLFGKNTSAGAISILTKRPTREVEASGGLRWDQKYQEYRVDGVLSGPISDNWAARLAVFSANQEDGPIKNIVRNTTENQKDRWGARFRTAYENGPLAFNMSLSYDRQDTNCCVRTFTGIDSASAGALTNNYLIPALNAYGITPSDRNRISLANGKTYERAKTLQGMWELSWELNSGHVLKSITGYRHWDQDEFNDVDFLPLNIISGAITHNLKLFTEEIQLISPADSPLEYVAGLYFYQQKLGEVTVFNGSESITGVSGVSTFDNEVKVNNIALFGQATYRFNEHWAAFAGARVLREKIEADGVRYGNFFAFPGNFAPASASNQDSAATGTAGVQFFPTTDTMFYASVSTGYKGAAIDTTIGSSFYTGNTDRAVLKPETVTSFELGSKTAFFDGKLSLNATLFHSKFKDFQATSFDGAANSFVLRNAGVLKSQGIETDLAAQPWEGGTFTLGVAFVDAKYDEFKGAPCTPAQKTAGTCSDAAGGQDLSGKNVNLNSRWQYTFTAQQEFNLAGMGAYARGEYSWRDRMISNGNLDPNTTVDAYGVANFRVGIKPSEHYDVALFVNNAFNREYAYRIGDAPLYTGAYGGYMAPERSYGVELKFNY